MNPRRLPRAKTPNIRRSTSGFIAQTDHSLLSYTKSFSCRRQQVPTSSRPMVGGRDTGQDALQRARKVLQAVMRHRHSKTLFNQPVDPEKLGLPDYFEIVKQPQDFGSILTRLHGTLGRGSKAGSYPSAEEVHQDVSLVFENCKVYNKRDQDSVTRTAAEEVQGIFEEKWAAAGLKGFNNTASQPSSQSPSAEASPSGSVEVKDESALALTFSVPGGRV